MDVAIGALRRLLPLRPLAWRRPLPTSLATQAEIRLPLLLRPPTPTDTIRHHLRLRQLLAVAVVVMVLAVAAVVAVAAAQAILSAVKVRMLIPSEFSAYLRFILFRNLLRHRPWFMRLDKQGHRLHRCWCVPDLSFCPCMRCVLTTVCSTIHSFPTSVRYLARRELWQPRTFELP